MSKRAFLFPGQGSQYVGMAKDLFEKSVEAKEMILTAEEATGVQLSHIMFNGPEEALKQTDITQPAIFVHSVILSSIIRLMGADMAAGHSLGEYSALVSAGAIQYYDAVKLVRKRGELMLRAGIEQPGTMAAVIGMDSDLINEICQEVSLRNVVQCANFNSPGQIVISGSVDGVYEAMKIAKEKGAKLVKELVVSGAFHSPLMSSAKEEFKKELDSTNFYDAKFPVYANVTAKPVTKKEEIIDALYKQLDKPVLWEDTIKNMISDGADEFVEIGPGKVLQGLVKRINPDVKFFGIDKYDDVERFL
ncbi:MAG TPA: [acyl-carrier-protein] S-malonyltransferase [Ignavibacteria bacterium]|nr:[acyl-carrier-protein] S-malonyltransferase [Ignavibacteria bacterium]